MLELLVSIHDLPVHLLMFRARGLLATRAQPLLPHLDVLGSELLSGCLSDGAHLVTCGAMSKQPFTLSNAHLIFRSLLCTGFWITNYYGKANNNEITDMFAELGQLIRQEVIHSPIEQTYLIRDCEKALAHAQQEGRKGKILFTF